MLRFNALKVELRREEKLGRELAMEGINFCVSREFRSSCGQEKVQATNIFRCKRMIFAPFLELLDVVVLSDVLQRICKYISKDDGGSSFEWLNYVNIFCQQGWGWGSPGEIVKESVTTCDVGIVTTCQRRLIIQTLKLDREASWGFKNLDLTT